MIASFEVIASPFVGASGGGIFTKMKGAAA
jgi:hypothetical protein